MRKFIFQSVPNRTKKSEKSFFSKKL